LYAAFFDAIEDASVDVGMKSQVVGVYEQDWFGGHAAAI
jgi:hypothetical protein